MRKTGTTRDKASKGLNIHGTPDLNCYAELRVLGLDVKEVMLS